MSDLSPNESVEAGLAFIPNCDDCIVGMKDNGYGDAWNVPESMSEEISGKRGDEFYNFCPTCGKRLR